MKNQEGLSIPEMVLRTYGNGEWSEVNTKALFENRKVVVFSLPGAFTPTCSSTHVPRYDQLVPSFKEQGIDEVICLAVNDPFVMDAWQTQQEAHNIRFLPDGNGKLTDALGMLVDKSDLNFGQRAWRYSMLVENGIVRKMFIEPDQPGDPFEVSDADTMLDYLNPDAVKPHSVTLFSKPGCPHCTSAKLLLSTHGYHYEEIVLGSNGLSFASLVNVTGATQTPQIYIDGARIGGAAELEEYIADKSKLSLTE
ncbi:MAG: glutathione peroxidase [Gammaproteobacteria bacterium]|nr:MAG: glutathione peroxidase [Gammaproteobacteria bacterium]